MNATPLYATLTRVVIGLAVYELVGVNHANPYLAAFAAGITLASTALEARDTFREFTDLISEITKLLTILIFGALGTPAVLADGPVGGYVFAVLLLVLARPAAVEVSLLGSELSWSRDSPYRGSDQKALPRSFTASSSPTAAQKVQHKCSTSS